MRMRMKTRSVRGRLGEFEGNSLNAPNGDVARVASRGVQSGVGSGGAAGLAVGEGATVGADIDREVRRCDCEEGGGEEEEKGDGWKDERS